MLPLFAKGLIQERGAQVWERVRGITHGDEGEMPWLNFRGMGRECCGDGTCPLPLSRCLVSFAARPFAPWACSGSDAPASASCTLAGDECWDTYARNLGEGGRDGANVGAVALGRDDARGPNGQAPATWLGPKSIPGGDVVKGRRLKRQGEEQRTASREGYREKKRGDGVKCIGRRTGHRGEKGGMRSWKPSAMARQRSQGFG